MDSESEKDSDAAVPPWLTPPAWVVRGRDLRHRPVRAKIRRRVRSATLHAGTCSSNDGMARLTCPPSTRLHVSVWFSTVNVTPFVVARMASRRESPSAALSPVKPAARTATSEWGVREVGIGRQLSRPDERRGFVDPHALVHLVRAEARPLRYTRLSHCARAATAHGWHPGRWAREKHHRCPSAFSPRRFPRNTRARGAHRSRPVSR